MPQIVWSGWMSMPLYSYATSEMMVESDSGGQDRQFCRSGQFTETAEIAESADQSFPVGQTSDVAQYTMNMGAKAIPRSLSATV
jgi:hypothetical protein